MGSAISTIVQFISKIKLHIKTHCASECCSSCICDTDADLNEEHRNAFER